MNPLIYPKDITELKLHIDKRLLVVFNQYFKTMRSPFDPVNYSLFLEKLDKTRKDNGIDKYLKLSRVFRKTTKEYETGPLNDRGILIKKNIFRTGCKSGAYSDKKGFGYWADMHTKTNIVVSPSDILAGASRKDFTHIFWYVY
jgi:hypothetical protein